MTFSSCHKINLVPRNSVGLCGHVPHRCTSDWTDLTCLLIGNSSDQFIQRTQLVTYFYSAWIWKSSLDAPTRLPFCLYNNYFCHLALSWFLPRAAVLLTVAPLVWTFYCHGCFVHQYRCVSVQFQLLLSYSLPCQKEMSVQGDENGNIHWIKTLKPSVVVFCFGFFHQTCGVVLLDFSFSFRAAVK